MTSSRQICLLALLSPLVLGLSGVDEVEAEGAAAVEEGFGSDEGVPDTDEADEDGLAYTSELALFEDTLSRFQNRMGEFRGEAKHIVERMRQEESDALDRSYDAVLSELEKDNLSLRATGIKRFEAFLDKYPRSKHSAHAMFRLAELYFEDSEEQFYQKDEEIRRLMEEATDADLANLPEEPEKDYKRSVQLYRSILDNFPEYEFSDGCYYMLGYCYSAPDSLQYDEEKGQEMFVALGKKYPESDFAAIAHLHVADYLFDYNRLDEAIAHYKQVVEISGREGPLYANGLYKLAWAEYKKSNYEQALTLLNELLDWSHEVHLVNTGSESDVEPEAIEYTAIAFSDIADLEGDSPTEVAKSFYRQIGERSFESKVFKRLADVLTQQARYKEAVEVYEYYQNRWPNDPENPTFQWTIGTLYASMVPPNQEQMEAAIAELNETYNDDSTWWQANRNNPDALSVARGYIEQSLFTVAGQYHEDAVNSGRKEDYAKASEMYGKYLTKFPFADDYYEIQWYLAMTLVNSGQMESAEREYRQLLKGGEHNYKLGAKWELFQIQRQQLVDNFGTYETVPKDVVAEKRITLPSGRERPVYQLGDEHAAFVAALDDLVASDFGSALDDVQAQLSEAKDPRKKEILQQDYEQLQVYQKALEQSRADLTYIPAQVLFYHGRYEEARPRFEEVIKRFPGKDVAAYSAALILDSFTDEENMGMVREYAGLYSGMSLGETDEGFAKTKEFAGKQEAATFKLAEQLITANKREAAAEAFLSFMEEFPESEHVKDSLYNAANSYEVVGRLDRSIALFEQYVNEYPTDEKSRPLFYRIADNYASALELEKAVDYYETLYNQTKGRGEDYQDAPAALFNAGFLRIGMGDHEGAAKNFERYARDNPEQEDAEQVLFRAGEEWEKVGDVQAARFYRNYIRNYPDTEPDHVMEAYYKLTEVAEKKGRRRDIDRAWDDLGEAYARLSSSGEVGAVGKKRAAHAAFRYIQDEFDAFNQIKFTKNEEKNAEVIKAKVFEELPAFEKRAQTILEFGDFEYSSASIYVIGLAYLRMSDMLYNAPAPKGMDDEGLMLYQEAIDELRLPAEERGKTNLQLNLDQAKEKKTWTEWQTTSLNELNSRFPSEYVKEKNEVRSKAVSAWVPTLGPVSVTPEEVVDQVAPTNEQDGADESTTSPANTPSNTETAPTTPVVPQQSDEPVESSEDASPWGGGQ